MIRSSALSFMLMLGALQAFAGFDEGKAAYP